MAARGVLPNETLDVFNKMIESVRRDLDLNLDETAWFYEILSNCSVRIDKDPVEALFKRFNACCNLGEIETVLPGGTQVNGVRIGPRSAYPNRPDYYDIDVMPDLFRPRDSLLIEVVYREPQLEAIRKMAGDMEKLISKVVKAVT
jgi:hypothetical protein